MLNTDISEKNAASIFRVEVSCPPHRGCTVLWNVSNHMRLKGITDHKHSLNFNCCTNLKSILKSCFHMLSNQASPRSELGNERNTATAVNNLALSRGVFNILHVYFLTLNYLCKVKCVA